MPQPRADLLQSGMWAKLCLNNRSPECFRLAFDRPSVAGPTFPACCGNVGRYNVGQNVVASASGEYSAILIGEGKGKGHPRTGHEGPDGRYTYSSTLSLTSAPDGVGGQSHAPAALSPGKTRYPLYRRLGGAQGWSGQARKISPPHRFSIPGS